MKQVNEDKNDKTVPILLIEKCSDGDDYKSRVLFSGKNSEEIEDCWDTEKTVGLTTQRFYRLDT